jgi:hypothetical protein
MEALGAPVSAAELLETTLDQFHRQIILLCGVSLAPCGVNVVAAIGKTTEHLRIRGRPEGIQLEVAGPRWDGR